MKFLISVLCSHVFRWYGPLFVIIIALIVSNLSIFVRMRSEVSSFFFMKFHLNYHFFSHVTMLLLWTGPIMPTKLDPRVLLILTISCFSPITIRYCIATHVRRNLEELRSEIFMYVYSGAEVIYICVGALFATPLSSLKTSGSIVSRGVGHYAGKFICCWAKRRLWLLIEQVDAAIEKNEVLWPLPLCRRVAVFFE